MEDLTNIWNAENDLNGDQLLNYVKGKSAKEEEHSVEKQMAESSFVNDAVEGLQSFSSPEKINSYTQQINEQLHQRLTEKKTKQKKHW